MVQSQKKIAGYTLIQSLVLLSMIVVSIFVAYLLFHGSDQSNVASSSITTINATTTTHPLPPSSTSVNPYAVLSPATVPSKTIECSQQLIYSSNGIPEPIKCPNGDLNVLVWNSLATLEPSVMSLGYNPSASKVETALCADVQSNISNPIEESTYQISSLYYGWNFTIDPSTVITNGTCVNVDD